MRAYGAYLLTLPWNPYLPVLWWFVFVLALWSVARGRSRHAPGRRVRGFAVRADAHLVSRPDRRARAPRRGRDRCGPRTHGAGDRTARRALWRWTGISVALGAVLWTPPVIDQVAHSPGNLDVIRDYFSHPPDSPIGFGRGVGVLLSQLNPWDLFTRILVHDGGGLEVTGSRVPGALLLSRSARRWSARGACATDCCSRSISCSSSRSALGLVSSARIFGTVWFYLLLWAWAIAALMLFAIGWTAVELGAAAIRRRPRGSRRRGRTRSSTVGAGRDHRLRRAGVGRHGADAPGERDARCSGGPDRATRSREREARRRPRAVPRHVASRRPGDRLRGLRLVERARPPRLRRASRRGVPARRHALPRDRFAPPDARGAPRDRARYRELGAATPGSREVAAFDPRSDAERAQFDELHGEVVGELRRAGLDRPRPAGRRQPVHARASCPRCPRAPGRWFRRCSTSACRWRSSSARPAKT